MDELSGIIDVLRKKGVVKLSFGGLEILMGPAPAMPASRPTNGDATGLDREQRRSHYAAMLGRPMTDHDLENLP